MVVVQECVIQVPVFYDLCQSEKWEEAREVAKIISALESDADRVKRKLQIKLHGDLFLPVPRGDVLALLQVQDNIANQAEDIVGLMLGRRMVFPSVLQKQIRLLIEHMIKTCNKAHEVSKEMRDLLEAGFQGVVLDLLQEMVGELDSLEDEADRLQAEIRESIFKIEDQHAPLDVFFWYKVVNEIASVIDWSQRVGAQLLIISAR